MQTSTSFQAAAPAPAAGCASLLAGLPKPLISLAVTDCPRHLVATIKAIDAEIDAQTRRGGMSEDSVRLRIELRHLRVQLLRIFGLDVGGGEAGQPAEVPACSCGIDGTICHPECPRRDA